MRGSSQKRGKGSWRLVFDLERDHTGKRRQKVVSFKGNKRDAEAELSRILAEIKNGGFVDPDSVTVAEYLERWMEYTSHSVSGKTLERYEGICRGHLIPALGEIKLQRLQPLQIQETYSLWLKSGNRRRKDGGGLSKRTVKHHHTVFKTALRQAVIWKLISSNPAEYVKPPRPDDREIKFLDKRETAVLLKATEGCSIYPIVTLAATTGMRLGEVLGLRWCDVDLNGGGLRVNQTVEKTKQGLRFKEPKSKSGRRSITLPQFTVKVLSKHRRQQDEQWRELHGLPIVSGEGVVALPGSEFAYPDDGLVFSMYDGRVLSPNAVSKSFTCFVRDLGIDQITFHGLRHGHITHLLMDGVPVKVVSERVGHAKVSHTLDLYGHVLPDMQESAAALVDRELSRAFEEHEQNGG